MNRINVLGVSFDNVTMDEAIARAMSLLHEGKQGYVVTPNPEIVMNARENPELMQAVSRASLVLPDGVGVIYGAKILGTPLQEKTPGIGFAAGVMEQLSHQGGSVYLFGAKPGVAELAGENLMKRFPGLKIAGTSDGYFTDDGPIVEKINAAHPDLLLVCLGSPKQEFWMQEHLGKVDAGLMAGLGGSLDVFAGVVERAPEKWQKLGLEWLYRLLKEPKRIGRMMKLPQFAVCAVKERVCRK